MSEFTDSSEIVEDVDRWNAQLAEATEELRDTLIVAPSMPDASFAYAVAANAMLLGSAMPVLHPDEDPDWWDVIMALRKATLCIRNRHDHVEPSDVIHARLVLAGFRPCSVGVACGIRAAELCLSAMHSTLQLVDTTPMFWGVYIPEIWEAARSAGSLLLKADEEGLQPDDLRVKIRSELLLAATSTLSRRSLEIPGFHISSN